MCFGRGHHTYNDPLGHHPEVSIERHCVEPVPLPCSKRERLEQSHSVFLVCRRYSILAFNPTAGSTPRQACP